MIAILTLYLFLGPTYDFLEINWQMLSDVKLISVNTENGVKFRNEFSASIKKLDGKQIRIDGYIIPIDEFNGRYALSAVPYSSCFFCGDAGPETVMEIKFKKEKRYAVDTYVVLVGTFNINETDESKLLYQISFAEETRK